MHSSRPLSHGAMQTGHACKRPLRSEHRMRCALVMLQIIHRDLKAENVLLTGAGAKGSADAKLADFGLHKLVQSNTRRGFDAIK